MIAFPKTWDAGIKLPAQDKSEDCWADCTAGVLGYLGLTVTQDDVRQRVIGDKNEPMTANRMAGIFALWGVSCVGPDVPLSADVLWAEVTADPIRPVLIGYTWNPPRSGGHVALVVGAREWTKRFLIQDPFFGPGELSWGEIAAGYGIGRWSVSFGRFELKEKQK